MSLPSATFNVNQRTNDISQRWLIVCPAWDKRSGDEWGPGQGQFFFEIVETARNRFNPEQVTYLMVEEGDSSWRNRVVDGVKDFKPTHILCQIEIDPDSSGNWTYDLLLDHLRCFWLGTFVMLMYDSVYPLHLARVDRITRRDSRSVVASIDRSVSGLYRGTAPCIGPLLLPISDRSLRELDNALSQDKHRHLAGLSFIGALYPYRKRVLDHMDNLGVEIQVNPHLLESEPASYRNYVSALAGSATTLNLARAHVFDIPQLKCRVLEAAAFGCVVFSDDYELTSTYFRPGLEFVYYSSPKDLMHKVNYFDANQDQLDEIRKSAWIKARTLAGTAFWTSVQEVL